MAADYIQVALDSTGKKMQTVLNTVAGTPVHAEAVTLVDSTGAILATMPVSGPLTDAQLRALAVPVSGTFWQATQPVSGTVTTSPPANASTNVAQVSGTATDTNSGLKSAGTLRVVLATDQPALTNKLLVTPDSVALPANQSVNNAQISGTAMDANSGLKSAGTMRVVLATDQPSLTNKLLVTPDSVALPANQSVNVAQMNGVATSMGTGIMGTGVQRVAIASDNDPQTVKQATGTNLHCVIDSGSTTVVTGTVTTKETRSATGTQTSVANSASNVTVLASNANRLGATIFNDDTAGTGAKLKIKLGATASSTSFTAVISPQGYYEVPFNYTGIIDGIASAATGNARVTELT